jgi:hypothetical protein
MPQVQRADARHCAPTPHHCSVASAQDAGDGRIDFLVSLMALKLPNKYEEGEFLLLLEHCQRVASRLSAYTARLQADFPAWIDGEDARLTVFARLRNQLSPAVVSAFVMHRHLAEPDWWVGLVGKRLDDRSLLIELLNYSQFVKIGLLHQVFSSIESTFRVFLRALDPDACGGGTAEFKTISDCLCAKLGIAHDDAAILDLLRNMRNTVHNAGVVFDRKARDLKVEYRGKTYDFSHQAIVEFAAWHPLLDWMDEAIALVHQVVRHPLIAGLPTPLRDPAATIV